MILILDTKIKVVLIVGTIDNIQPVVQYLVV